MEEHDIIDAEVVSEKTIEVKRSEEPKKVRSDVSTSMERLKTWSARLLVFARRFLLLFAIGGLVFTILHSQNALLVFLIFLSIFWILAGIALIAMVVGLVLHFRMMSQLNEPGGEQ